MKKWLVLTALALLLTGLRPGPTHRYELGDLLLDETFDQPDAWESFTIASSNTEYHVGDGVYHTVTGGGGFIWGLNSEEHTDVVIEVETNQVAGFDNNAYGVMCRADTSNNGDGYYFLISGDGFYSIAIGEGNNIDPLVDWTASDVIHQGNSSNTIRAVCTGNYLALYANDVFLTDTEDSTYTSGYAGIATAVFQDGQSVSVDFDNLKIWSATLKN